MIKDISILKCPVGRSDEPGVPINGERSTSCGIIFENRKIRILTNEELKDFKKKPS